MKKLLTISITLIAGLSLAACNNNSTSTKTESSHQSSQKSFTSKRSTSNVSSSSSVTTTASTTSSNSAVSTSSSSTINTRNLSEAQAEQWIWHHYNGNGSERPVGEASIVNTNHQDPDYSQDASATYFQVINTGTDNNTYFRITSDGILQKMDSNWDWHTVSSTYDA